MLVLPAAAAWGQEWAGIGTVSTTMGAKAGRLCVGEGDATDSGLGCPTYAPSLTTTGDVSVTGSLSAQQFIGDGSMLTGLAGGDRISSGTLAAIVNSATSVISLSTAGTTWGYFSSLMSYLPRISAERVSSSFISGTYIHLSSSTTPLACDGGLAGAMRYSSGTVQVCDGLDWSNVGIGIPTGSIVAFAASSCPAGWAEYTPARGRFLRGIDNGAGNDPAGTRAPGNVQADMVGPHNHQLAVSMGTSGGYGIRDAGDATSTGAPWTHNNSGTETRPKNVAVTYCQYTGVGGGGGGGSGVMLLASLTDVSTAGAAPGNVLAYDGSMWVVSSVTAGSSAEGDRITSGTLAMVANSTTSVVSLSTAGTTWGYLSSLMSYLPRINAERVSSSFISGTYIHLSSSTTPMACDGGLAGTMRYSSGTVQVCDGLDWSNVGIGIPTGSIVAFATSSCPAGWVEYTPARGRFLRGIDNGAGNDPSGTRTPGGTQVDTLQNITGSFKAAGGTGGIDSAAGAFYIGNSPATYTAPDQSANAAVGFGVFDASRVVRTSAETRPKNVAVTYCQYTGVGGGGGGGNGVMLLASLTDVSTAGAAPGNVLAYDGSMWVVSSVTAGSSAEGDRITSGTLAMVANGNTSSVSLSMAGTTWGYFSSLMSYLPQVTAGQVSATNISGSLIQVGSGNGAACDAARRGALRYSTTSSTVQYCNSTAWVSMGPSSTQPVAFFAHKGGTNQTVPTGVATKLTWSSERFDTNNNFASDRFTVTVPGKYMLSLNIFCTDSTSLCAGYLMKNGSSLAQSYMRTTGDAIPTVTAIIDAVPGDYFEAFGTNGGGTVIGGNAVHTNFSGALLAPQGGGGGGATDIDELNDVNTAGATTGSILAYNGSAWVVSTTGGSAALGDRITSGTLAMITNSATSVVSLSTAGTTWGYFGSLNSYLPQLMSGRVSATNISASVVNLGSANIGVLGGAGGNFVASGTTSVSTSMNSSITFTTAGVSRMVLTPGGRLGIGTPLPSQALHVQGGGVVISRNTFAANTEYLSLHPTDYAVNKPQFFIKTEGTSWGMGLWDGASSAGTINYYAGSHKFHSLTGFASMTPSYAVDLPNSADVWGRGRANQWTTYSDGRFKTDRKPIQSALQKVLALNGITYRSTLNDNAPLELGYIAQDVEKILPEVVSIASTTLTLADGGSRTVHDYRSLDYARLVPVLSEAIKELKADNDNLRSELNVERARGAELSSAVDVMRQEVRQLKNSIR